MAQIEPACSTQLLVELLKVTENGDIEHSSAVSALFPSDCTLAEIAAELGTGNDYVSPHNATPRLHLWLEYKNWNQITCFGRMNYTQWFEVFDDSLDTKLCKLQLKKKKNEKISIAVEYQNCDGTWPRAKSPESWQNFNVGDIIDCQNCEQNWYEALIAETDGIENMHVYGYGYGYGRQPRGRVMVHYIGLDHSFDEWVDVNSDRIKKRHTKTKGPFRSLVMPPMPHMHSQMSDTLKAFLKTFQVMAVESLVFPFADKLTRIEKDIQNKSMANMANLLEQSDTISALKAGMKVLPTIEALYDSQKTIETQMKDLEDMKNRGAVAFKQKNAKYTEKKKEKQNQIRAVEQQLLAAGRQVKKMKARIRRIETQMVKLEKRKSGLSHDLRCHDRNWDEKCRTHRKDIDELNKKIKNHEEEYKCTEKEMDIHDKVARIEQKLENCYGKIVRNWYKWDGKETRAFLKMAVMKSGIPSDREDKYLSVIGGLENRFQGNDLKLLNSLTLKVLGFDNDEDVKKINRFVANAIAISEEDREEKSCAEGMKKDPVPEKSDLCLMCADAKIEMVFAQCGHMCYCHQCYVKQENDPQYDEKKCSQCQIVSSVVIKVFASGLPQ